MKSKQTMFFTVLEDMEQIVQNIEALIEIRYFEMGLLDNEIIPTYNSLFETPNVGTAFSGDWNNIDTYLIMKKSTLLNIEKVPQRAGGIKFNVSQGLNLKSIELKLGGVYNENVIVAGRIATISEDVDSNELYKLFTTKIKKEFKKIGVFYVGKKAEEKLKLGWRLVTNEKSPKEYDLALS